MTKSVFGDQRRSVELLWNEAERPRRGPKPGLSLERIVRAAIEIADAHGLDTVSMERVAKEFGFTTMSLYRYVPGKAELIDLMIDIGLGEPPELDASRAWRSQLEDWARRLRSIFNEHPWTLAATGRLRVMGPNELKWLEVGLSALSGTGLTASERRAACLAVLGQVRSMAQFSVNTAPLTSEQWETATRALMKKHGDAYPELSAALAAAPSSKEDPFSFGLRCVLDGIGLLVAKRGGRRSRSR